MDKVIGFGEVVEGYNIPVLNEREIRAAAGILFLMMFTSVMVVILTENFLMLKYAVTIFFTDIVIRVAISPKYSPTLILGRLIVRNQVPEYVFRITFDIAFQHPCIALQQRSVKVTSEGFRRDLAPARTFGFLRDVEMLKSAGLARGGSLGTAIVVDDERILNPEGLRCQDEFVRHKILDAIGDLSLIGYPILGHVRAFKAGHDVNHHLVQKVLENPEDWQILEFSEDDLEKSLQMAPQTFATDLAFSKA